MEMFAQHLAQLAKKGVKVTPGSQQYEEIKASIVPPYDVGKFPNKWRKMWRDQPARTLMAHLGKDSVVAVLHQLDHGCLWPADQTVSDRADDAGAWAEGDR